ncbi:MAG: ABC transporter ATP-binding protein [Bryobacterales bacterium]|nr:ABC transporter ATP-binding protein [Bryobacterales bacterium]
MLEVRHLTKRFRGMPAVQDLNFTVRPYEVCGYLGPNGSGKSTTFKVLTGLMQPSEGQVLYEGRSILNDPVAFKKRLGFVPEEPLLYTYLSGAEYLELVGQLRQVPWARLKRRIAELLRLLSLEGDRHTPLSAYSKGMRQKVLIAAALLDEPEVVILDEPFSGLDVATSLMLKQLMASLAAAGKIVIYSSHVLEVVEKVCSRVIILHRGRILADDSVANLRALMSAPSLEAVFAQLAVDEDSAGTAARIMEAMRL